MQLVEVMRLQVVSEKIDSTISDVIHKAAINCQGTDEDFCKKRTCMVNEANTRRGITYLVI